MARLSTFFLMVPVVATLAAVAGGGEPPGADGQFQPMPLLAQAMVRGEGGGGDADELPKFDDVAKGYTKVVSTADGERSLWTLWTRDKDAQMLAELPRNFESQLLFMAHTIAGGTPTAGVQSGDIYVKWRRFNQRLALIEPNFEVRSTGDRESQLGRDRVFTDRVILDVGIVAMGPGGGPVIDLDALLVAQAPTFLGFTVRGINTALVKIVKAKAFPENVEVAFEAPLAGGRFGTMAYSIKALPENTGYQPREADERIGYFTTVHQDVGDAGADTPWKRYVNRWKLEKADPRLKLSPPKEPIIFYLEHTTPVRYRRWVRDGVLEWNKAYEKVGILNAIEVYQQDARTGAHMDKDPEDARFNFVLWTNANMGFAIGPSRVDPRTGQILDADIVMDEGFITSYVQAWKKTIPEQAMEGFGPQTMAWLEAHPQWDPRVRLAPPAEREMRIAQIQRDRAARGPDRLPHPAANADPTLMGDDAYDGLYGRLSQVNGLCLHGVAKSLDVALYRLSPELFAEMAQEPPADPGAGGEGGGGGDAPKPEGDLLDGVPDSFIGPLLKEVVMHEVGHTLGLRHNFKASTIRTLGEINSPDGRGKAQVASVMDYNPININMGDGPVQGDYTTSTIGPYDYWAIEYGYTFESDLKPIVARVAEKDLPYGTDEDTWGPDPRARRFDYAADPLEYADSQMRLVKHLRGKILERMVKDGQSWARAREGYEILLGRHFGAVAIAANWVGGSYVNRDKKGDPGARTPVTPIEVERQRRALNFVIENALRDEAFGLSPDLLRHMTVDKWWDAGGFTSIFEDETWPVHDRIAALQAVALTMVLNPTTLNRVFDNEYIVAADQEALTLPDVLYGVSDAVWSEFAERPRKTYTARQPMVSSLRRVLQAEHLERLIDLSLPGAGMGTAGRAISNLSVQYLRELNKKLEAALKDADRLDPYTKAHVSEANVRITKALDAQYVYNTDDLGGGAPMPMFFMRPAEEPRP
jgi:hypothetical protein